MLEQKRIEPRSKASPVRVSQSAPNVLQVWRHWLAISVCCLAALLTWAQPARAADAEPDKTGAFQMTPTPASVPGYSKLDPKKMTPEEVRPASMRSRSRPREATSPSTSFGC